jgi:hypothetical protein
LKQVDDLRKQDSMDPDQNYWKRRVESLEIQLEHQVDLAIKLEQQRDEARNSANRWKAAFFRTDMQRTLPPEINGFSSIRWDKKGCEIPHWGDL